MKHRYSARVKRTTAIGKTCNRCGADEWYGPYGSYSQYFCAVCKRQEAAAWKLSHPLSDSQRYARNRAQILRRKKAWRKERPPETWAREVLQHARSRAKQFDIPCTLTFEFLRGHLGTHCPVFGNPWVLQRGGFNPNSPSLDRLDCKGGYTEENVRVISHRANIMKSDGTLKEHQRLVEWMIAEGVK